MPPRPVVRWQSTAGYDSEVVYHSQQFWMVQHLDLGTRRVKSPAITTLLIVAPPLESELLSVVHQLFVLKHGARALAVQLQAAVRLLAQQTPPLRQYDTLADALEEVITLIPEHP